MTDPYAAAPEPPADRSRLGCGVFAVVAFLFGFVLVGAVLLLRAPDAPGDSGGSSLATLLREPPGYVRLPDERSGGGRLSKDRAATLLGRTDVPQFNDGVLRAWGRPAGEPPRAVIVLVVEVETGEQASALRRGYVDRAVANGATRFATPTDLQGDGLHDLPDGSGRVAQRVVFTRGVRLFVVSVVTPERERDTAEVVRLATEQSVTR